MFQNCKNEDELLALFNRLKALLGQEGDLLKLLQNDYDLSLKKIRELFILTKGYVYPGKYQKVACEKIEEYDDRISELMTDMLRYHSSHPEFHDSSGAAFMSNVGNFLGRNGYISGKQYNILIDIYYKQNMEASRIDAYS